MGDEWVTNTNSHTPFDNPTFNQDETYDSISTATGGSLADKVRQDNKDDDNSGISNPTYDVAFSEGRQKDDPEPRYASLQGERELPKGEEYPGKDDDYMKPVDFQFGFSQQAAKGEENYDKIRYANESHA